MKKMCLGFLCAAGFLTSHHAEAVYFKNNSSYQIYVACIWRRYFGIEQPSYSEINGFYSVGAGQRIQVCPNDVDNVWLHFEKGPNEEPIFVPGANVWELSQQNYNLSTGRFVSGNCSPLIICPNKIESFVLNPIIRGEKLLFNQSSVTRDGTFNFNFN